MPVRVYLGIFLLKISSDFLEPLRLSQWSNHPCHLLNPMVVIYLIVCLIRVQLGNAVSHAAAFGRGVVTLILIILIHVGIVVVVEVGLLLARLLLATLVERGVAPTRLGWLSDVFRSFLLYAAIWRHILAMSSFVILAIRIKVGICLDYHTIIFSEEIGCRSARASLIGSFLIHWSIVWYIFTVLLQILLDSFNGSRVVSAICTWSDSNHHTLLCPIQSRSSWHTASL